MNENKIKRRLYETKERTYGTKKDEAKKANHI
jgi:hypothetical protein